MNNKNEVKNKNTSSKSNSTKLSDNLNCRKYNFKK